MTHFNWRSAALVSLTSLVFAAFAIAQQASNTDQEQSGSSQASASNSSSQGQSNAANSSNANSNRSDNTTNTSNKQSDSTANKQNENAQSKDATSSQNQSKQDQAKQGQAKQGQSNQNRDNRSSRDSASDRSSSNTERGNDQRDTAASDRDDRTSRDRSSRDADRNADRDRNRDRDSDRNVDSSSSRSDRDSSRDGSSRRGNMRGPDIGIWFSRSSRDGLVIADVSSRGAIAKLGFREGDRIVSIDGRRVTREEDFIQYLLRRDARRVTVIVLRDNREETIHVEPAVLLDEGEYVEVDPLERFGIILDDRYDDRIVVWRVIPRSPAYYAGFRPGDVIATFAGRPYRTRTEFERGSRDWKTGEANVQIRRGERTRDLSVDIPSRDRMDARTSERSQVRDGQTGQRDSSVTPAQATTPDTNRSDRNTNDRRDINRRGGILNRGNR